MDEWLEIRVSFIRHPKLIGFAREMRLALPHAAGLLLSLWSRTAEIAPSGDLAHFADADIADMAGWTGDTVALCGALRKPYPPKMTAWIDEDGKLHDWYDYFGRLLEIREAKKHADRERQAKRREKLALMSGVSPPNVTRDVACDSQNVTRESRHNQTRPDQTKGEARLNLDASGPPSGPAPPLMEGKEGKIRDGKPRLGKPDPLKRLFPKELKLVIDQCQAEMDRIRARGKNVNGRTVLDPADEAMLVELRGCKAAAERKLREAAK